MGFYSRLAEIGGIPSLWGLIGDPGESSECPALRGDLSRLCTGGGRECMVVGAYRPTRRGGSPTF